MAALMETREGAVSRGGVTILLPYAMPATVNEHGENEPYGRYCIAYSRDGWFLLDTEDDVVLRWCVSEDDAVAARLEVISS